MAALASRSMSGRSHARKTPLTAVALAAFTVAERRLALPDTALDLVWADGRIVVIGPMSRARPTRLAVGTRALLLSLDPLVGGAWLRTPLELLTDRVVEVADIDRELSARLSQRCAEGRAHELVSRAPHYAAGPEPRLAAAAARLAAGVRVARAAQEVGLSERQLERRFHSQVGLSPKHFARIVRLRRAVKAAKAGASLATAAHEAGYADQSHFTREVKALTGVPPLEALPHVGNVQDISHHRG